MGLPKTKKALDKHLRLLLSNLMKQTICLLKYRFRVLAF